MADASKIIMTGGDSPETPLSGTSVIYFKTDGKLYTKNDSGEESEVGTGGGGIEYTSISTNTNAEVSKGYLINSTSNTVTLTLPLTPILGDTIAVVDSHHQSSTNAITIARNGSKIEGQEEDLVLDIDGSGFTLVYVDTTRGWEIVSEINNGAAITSLFELDSNSDIQPTSDMDVVPRSNNTGSVGTSAKKWASVNATNINELTISKQTTGFTIAGGTTSKTLTLDIDLTASALVSQADLIALSIALGG